MAAARCSTLKERPQASMAPRQRQCGASVLSLRTASPATPRILPCASIFSAALFLDLHRGPASDVKVRVMQWLDDERLTTPVQVAPDVRATRLRMLTTLRLSQDLAVR